MKAGIQDALNLGWKLAFATRVDRPSLVLLSFGAPLLPWLMTAGPRLLSRSGLNSRRSPLSVEEVPRARSGPRPRARLADIEVSCGGCAGAAACPARRARRAHPAAGRRRGSRDRVAGRRAAGVRSPGVALPGVALPGIGLPGAVSADARIHVHCLTDRPGTGVRIVRSAGCVGFRAASVDPCQITDWLSPVGLGWSASRR